MGHYSDYTGNPRKTHKFISEFGLDSMFKAEDVLDMSDPTSGIFDDEDEGRSFKYFTRTRTIHDLEISIS